MADDDYDLKLKATAIAAVNEAFKPYASMAADVDALKRDWERRERFAPEDAKRAEADRQRLASDLADQADRRSEEMAEKVVNRIMASLGLDPEKPADFVRLMTFVKDLQDTLKEARKHGITVIVGLIVMGIAGLVAKALIK